MKSTSKISTAILLNVFIIGCYFLSKYRSLVINKKDSLGVDSQSTNVKGNLNSKSNKLADTIVADRKGKPYSSEIEQGYAEIGSSTHNNIGVNSDNFGGKNPAQERDKSTIGADAPISNYTIPDPIYEHPVVVPIHDTPSGFTRDDPILNRYNKSSPKVSLDVPIPMNQPGFETDKNYRKNIISKMQKNIPIKTDSKLENSTSITEKGSYLLGHNETQSKDSKALDSFITSSKKTSSSVSQSSPNSSSSHLISSESEMTSSDLSNVEEKIENVDQQLRHVKNQIDTLNTKVKSLDSKKYKLDDTDELFSNRPTVDKIEKNHEIKNKKGRRLHGSESKHVKTTQPSPVKAIIVEESLLNTVKDLVGIPTEGSGKNEDSPTKPSIISKANVDRNIGTHGSIDDSFSEKSFTSHKLEYCEETETPHLNFALGLCQYKDPSNQIKNQQIRKTKTTGENSKLKSSDFEPEV